MAHVLRVTIRHDGADCPMHVRADRLEVFRHVRPAPTEAADPMPGLTGKAVRGLNTIFCDIPPDFPLANVADWLGKLSGEAHTVAVEGRLRAMADGFPPVDREGRDVPVCPGAELVERRGSAEGDIVASLARLTSAKALRWHGHGDAEGHRLTCGVGLSMTVRLHAGKEGHLRLYAEGTDGFTAEVTATQADLANLRSAVVGGVLRALRDKLTRIEELSGGGFPGTGDT